jgi:hypothetical protein
MAKETDRLRGVRAKIARAYEHRDSLDKEFLTLQSTNNYAIVRDEQLEAGYYVYRIKMPTIPDRWSAIVGDCLQNARSALDVLAVQLDLAERARRSPGAFIRPKRNVSFPICASSDELWGTGATAPEQAKVRNLGSVSADVKALVDGVQTYKRPDSVLGALNELARIDRHQLLHIVVLVSHACVWLPFRDGAIASISAADLIIPGFSGPIEDGAVVAKVRALPGYADVHIYGGCPAFIALEGDQTLPLLDGVSAILAFVDQEVITSLASFV